ncbi:GIY-YIG nuclease family protein [Microbacterium sp. SSM24]|uniref:GIY-YIG nuclease family protein n=1 Tax=Microbacterium sp. SSM24 TaxID=2991714 RepID=UPI0022262AD2|nr:GIY-YIG nuclease family protein [Microbacterium sp. SSM24]MCW3494360.1 GIY-YIG nuclease family protein [Microbacterium sp. SSM24]
MPDQCLVRSGCRGSVSPESPVSLCDWHLAAASEWEQSRHGVTDVLPSPCGLCGSPLGVRYPSGWLCAVCEWRHGELVDHELPPPRVDVVYYLRFDDRIKIGTTGNPRQRLSAIWHHELLAFERGDRTRERRRHTEFAEDRFTGTEWFRRSPALLAHIDVLAAGVDDPWALHARWTSEAIARGA